MEPDQEEEKLQNQLQGVLQSCAVALGMEIPIANTQPEFEDQQMEKEGEKAPKVKRPRSLEPFGGPGSAGGPREPGKT